MLDFSEMCIVRCMFCIASIVWKTFTYLQKGQEKAREGQAYCKNISFNLCPGLNSQSKVQLQECRATREAYNQSVSTAKYKYSIVPIYD